MKQQNWISLTSVQVGGAVCLPVLLVGFELTKTYGFASAFLAILLGNSLLFGLSLISARMSCGKNISTVEHAEEHLGPHAKKLFACAVLFSMSVWFAVQTQLMAQNIIHVLPESMHSYESILAVLIGINIVVCARSGMTSIEKLANIAVPLMIGTMLTAAYYGNHRTTTASQFEINGSAISLILATSIAAVVDMPTFFRHAASPRDAYKASIATFVFGIPIVELLGAYLQYTTNAPSLIDALYCFSGNIWEIWILFFVFLAGWTTNNTNLYSANMATTSLLQTKEHKAFMITGAFGVLLTCFTVLDKLELVVTAMGILIIAIGGVMLTGHLFSRQDTSRLNIYACCIGAGAGSICYMKGSLLTTIPILDTMLVASLCTACIAFTRRKPCFKTLP